MLIALVFVASPPALYRPVQALRARNAHRTGTSEECSDVAADGIGSTLSALRLTRVFRVALAEC